MSEITLEKLGEGAVSEMFSEAVQKVVDNVLDLNTEARAKRSIVLKMTICPSENRNCATIQVEITPKFAPDKAFATRAMMGRDKHTGMGQMAEYTNRQLFDDDGVPAEEETKITVMKRREG